MLRDNVVPYRRLLYAGYGSGRARESSLVHQEANGIFAVSEGDLTGAMAWVETTANLVFFRQHERGGHFAALEYPDALLADLEEFIGQV